MNFNLPVVTIKAKTDPFAPKKSGHGHHKVANASIFLTPPEVYEHLTDTGADKARSTYIREFSLGILAGCYIGFGFSMCMMIGGQLKGLKIDEPGLFNIILGAFGFPFGLTMVVLGGGNLFTSNTVYMLTAIFEGKARWRDLVRVWTISYIANFIGCLIQAQMMTWGEVYHGREEYTLSIALKKTSYPFGVCMVKGMICNWLVNMAVWQANVAQDVPGKFIGIWLPISAFVAMGLEHSVANMFMIPFSMMIWSPEHAEHYPRVSVGRFLAGNLIPTTIGNILGACIFVGCFYALAYGSWAEKFEGEVKEWINEKLGREERPRALLSPSAHPSPSATPSATPMYYNDSVTSPNSETTMVKNYFAP